jgi:hypothetical protein
MTQNLDCEIVRDDKPVPAQCRVESEAVSAAERRQSVATGVSPWLPFV